MELPGGQPPYHIVEVRFKNGRKEYYRNANGLQLVMGEPIAVDAQPGFDIGSVSLTGELVRIQVRKKAIKDLEELPKVLRKATEADLHTWHKVREMEESTMLRARTIARQHQLDMKVSDVEFQGDGTKAVFYYTAEQRVDFRAMIKDLAGEFKVRVEMRQIGARQEAARLGGIGSCGRELCCSTWLTDFRSVSTSAARYQQLALNPQKLAGQCGKLKCCLNYELDSYMEAVKSFPSVNTKLKTRRGDAQFQKMDIFGGWVWYAYSEDPMNWIRLRAEDASKIVEQNKRGDIPEALEDMAAPAPVAEPVYTNVVGQDDLTRFDRQGGQNRKKKRKKRPGSGEARAAQPVPNQAGTAQPPREGGQRDRNRNRNRNRPPRGNQPPQA